MDEITSKFKNAFERMAELESLQLSMEEDTNEDMKEKWRHERFENSKKDGFQEEEGVCSVFNYMSTAPAQTRCTIPKMLLIPQKNSCYSIHYFKTVSST